MRAEFNKLKRSPLFIAFGFMCYVAISIALVVRTYDNWWLHTYGIAATASVTEITLPSGRGMPTIKYQFTAVDPSGVTYRYAGSDSLPKPDALNFTPGDQVLIHYDLANPLHSRMENAAVVEPGFYLACPGFLIILGGLAALIMLGARYVRKRRPV